MAGFVMKKAENYKDIHVVYGTGSRKQYFPHANYKFLVKTAINLAIAFEVVHSHDYVIGDVNEKFALVSKDAIVKLIDCDSYQVMDGSKIHRCLVGVDMYQPPEIQLGGSYASVTRNL